MELKATPLEIAYDKVMAAFQIDGGNVVDTDVLGDTQITVLTEFMVTLSTISKEAIQNMDVEDLYVAGAGWFTPSYAPYTAIYNIRTMLQFVERLLSVVSGKLDFEVITTYKSQLSSLLEIIEEVIEDYAKKIFSERLCLRMSEKGLTQQALADYLQIKQASVQQWCSGNGYPKINTLIMLANTLDCSVDALIRPDCIEHDFGKDTLFKSIGLHTRAIELLRGLVRDKKIESLNAVNLILSNKELIGCFTEFFNMPFESSLSVIPFSELLDLQQTIQMADCKEDAISYAKGFLENYISLDIQDAQMYQLDKIQLIEIIQVLSRLRDKRIKEFY